MDSVREKGQFLTNNYFSIQPFLYYDFFQKQLYYPSTITMLKWKASKAFHLGEHAVQREAPK